MSGPKILNEREGEDGNTEGYVEIGGRSFGAGFLYTDGGYWMPLNEHESTERQTERRERRFEKRIQRERGR